MFHVVRPAIILKPPSQKYMGGHELASQNYIDLIRSIQPIDNKNHFTSDMMMLGGGNA
jgi:hypothetical protein